jgi:signal peptidase I
MTTTAGIDDQTAPAPPAPLHVGFIRQAVESVIVLTVAVLAFRLFVAEGYMISTGSMAPSLLGYHKQVECPSCHYRFASGVLVDDDEVPTSGSAQAQDLQGDLSQPPTQSICPNCGLHHIETAALPQNEGDQLMVHKHAYQFRDPRRWEVIVFKNPTDPLQAYVKRVVGLPGEVVAIREGDIYIDDRLQPRSLEAQRGMAILVDDHDHEPQDDPEWQPRWIVNRPDSGWQTNGKSFVINAPLPATTSQAGEENRDDPLPDFDWLTFRHWIRSGGRHVTTVPLSRWPAGAGFPPAVGSIKYDLDQRRLTAVGVVEKAELAVWEERSTDPVFLRAVRSLTAASHEAPILDEYGYNKSLDGDSTFVVRDLLTSFELKPKSGKGIAAVSIDDGHNKYVVYFDFGRGVAGVREVGQSHDLQEAVLNHAPGKALTVEVSLMDRQLLVALNGEPLFPAISQTDQHAYEPPAPTRPIAIGTAGGSFEVRSLKVFRDVYYTPKSDANLIRRMNDDEFFVLGDNSPVSVDSRCWDDPAVKRENLVGKPVVVHLPSQQGKISLFGETKFVRIPDFSRVRYIH